MIRVGIAGIGFMGMTHYRAYQKVRGAKVVALCEQDSKRLAGDWRSIKGNFGAPGEMMDLKGIACYAALDEMLSDEQIDLVDVCLPGPLHAEVTIAALRKGKHVFCEKPISLKPNDAKRMVEAAQQAGKLLMIGHVLAFNPEYQFAYRAVTGGKYGRLLGGHFKRVIAYPLWIPDYFNADKTGGPMIDLHIHDAHFIRLICGMPRAVHSVGRLNNGVAELFHTQFLFEDPSLVVTASSGVLAQQGRAFTHAFEIYLERATLLFDFAVLDDKPVTAMPLTMLDKNGKVLRPTLGPADPVEGFVGELKEVVRSVRANTPSPILGGELARDALFLCQKETDSIRTGRAVKV
jgi:predicted dehydrogenase